MARAERVVRGQELEDVVLGRALGLTRRPVLAATTMYRASSHAAVALIVIDVLSR
jgi:hypothetical protein